MQGYPTITELIEAVRGHLTTHLIPTLSEPRLRFQTLVAANVLAVVARELELGQALGRQEWHRLANLLGHTGDCPADVAAQEAAIGEWNRLLCQQIEGGMFDDPAGYQHLLAHCRQTAQAHLQIANPKFLTLA